MSFVNSEKIRMISQAYTLPSFQESTLNHDVLCIKHSLNLIHSLPMSLILCWQKIYCKTSIELVENKRKTLFWQMLNNYSWTLKTVTVSCCEWVGNTSKSYQRKLSRVNFSCYFEILCFNHFCFYSLHW